MSATVFAADDSTVQISVIDSASGASVDGHTYNVYQIFTGTVAADGVTLSDIEIGANINKDTYDVDDVQTLITGKTAAEAAEALKGIISKDPVVVLNDSNDHKASVVPGYYLIVDVTEKLPENETSSAFILQVLQSVEIKSKHTAGPGVEKKIDDTNNSTDATNEIIWHDSADHDIGDLIDFQITTTLPSAFKLFVDNKKAYPYTLHDTEEAGLTFQPDSVVVKIGENTLVKGTDYTVVYRATDGHTFDIEFADLTKVTGAEVGAKIVVNYKSMLNENAVLGSKGNLNTVFGEFRNYYDDDEPSFTPEDTVIAFTYKVVVKKVKYENGEYKPLSGATFTLEKFVAKKDGAVEYPKDSAIKGEWVALKTVETNPNTTFSFRGLDDGYYRLTETVAPDGYNKIDPIEFEVKADHKIEWSADLKRTDILTSLTGNVTSGEINFTPAADGESANAVLSTDVLNESGSLLPETGGIGTTIFYVIGGVLVAIAIVLLVTKKRMKSSN